MRLFYSLSLSMFLAFSAQATQLSNQTETKRDYLVKLAPHAKAHALFSELEDAGSKVEPLALSWVRVTLPANTNQKLHNHLLASIKNYAEVEYVQPNYRIKLLENYQVQDADLRARLADLAHANKEGEFPIPGPGQGGKKTDNPEIPTIQDSGKGEDPKFAQQWGMKDIGVKAAWNQTMGSHEMVVAVIDTGVDYTHEDLVGNLWTNNGETGTDADGKDKSKNGVDDDKNGYIDDTIGWDFVSNDNKPYDLTVGMIDLMLGGGNPGHGTHCAGNVAARANNGKGIAGVAPNVKIMSLRFLSEKGQGTTADAVKAVAYAVDNGAQVLSNSWGSEGEDESDTQGNQALKDIINYTQQKGALFVAAAGNGHQGVGYDNDKDAKPAYPASYAMDTIVSVAALDANNQLGKFSNWGEKSVDLGAPGVKVFSTVPGAQYSDTVINMFGMVVTWDGTSMATPHVAGAAALYWSRYPEKTWSEVKAALMSSSKKISVLSGKTVSGGKLDVDALMRN